MKRIKFMLLAIAMLLAAPAFLTSCQEDAPEINYTMNVSVINDFTKVVEAINNGSLKNEQAIAKLTEAIDKMNADQQTKLQAIIDVLNSVNATLDTKLAAIEAAMKAQTLTLESKLALLETAIKNQTIKQEEMADKLVTAINNLSGSSDTKIDAIAEAINSLSTALQSKLALIEAAIKAQTLSMEAKLDLLEQAIKAMPDYTSQLAAIKTAIETLPDYSDKIDALVTAIKAMPDYSDKFDAVVAALNAMKTQVETLGTGQTAIAEKIGEVTAAINSLIASVNSGNTSAAEALAQIIQKLEELKAAIEGGGDSTPDFTGTVTLDGVPMPIIDAGIDEDEFNEGNYDIVLFVSENRGVKIMANKVYHDGNTIDLTKKEPTHDDGWYWSVECYNPTLIFDTYGEPGTPYPVFMSGTLYVKSLDSEDGKPVFEIVLENGKVKGEGEYGDGKEHTISLNFKGSMRFDDY
ncbi:hypothetical protein [Prevotella sp. KH2C16]|uniref:hypothetical protein n=1 Tax=Prevotella sp. KH2C16 TaxID=1855325 RepID=UPI0008EB6D00|nr:hypothetical protein [Prevotella sp. KH2C16]SFG77120.1 hypothetical protein SAMN05216383_1433 [Prevotella sp. KH2C16]